MSDGLSETRFVELLSRNTTRMRSYAIALVSNAADADDLLQNASLAVWEHRDRFDQDRDFFRWACGFLLIEVRRFRQNKGKEKLLFSDKLLTMLSTDYLADADFHDSRREYLHKCLPRLKPKDLTLLKDRYGLNLKPKEISKLRGQPLPTVYGSLKKIRGLLHRCIEAHLSQQT